MTGMAMAGGRYLVVARPKTEVNNDASYCGDHRSQPRNGVSANASETKPAKLLAVFVVDTNETELTIPFGNGG